jgi:hypothetical protein
MVVVEQETTLRLAGSIFAFSPNDLIKSMLFNLSYVDFCIDWLHINGSMALVPGCKC